MARFDINEFIKSGDDESIYEDEDASNSLYAQSVLHCENAIPMFMRIFQSGLKSCDSRQRACAAMAAAALTNLERFSENKPKLASELLRMCHNAETSDERSALVLALNDLGTDPHEFLHDESPGVRLCAALGNCFYGRPQSGTRSDEATAEVLKVFNNSTLQVDNFFNHKPPQFCMPLRLVVLHDLLFCHPVQDFNLIADGAETCANITKYELVDYEWGPLLQAAFPKHDGIVKSNAQRRFLKALVKNTKLWNSSSDAPLRWFKQAGLSYNRSKCEKL